MVNSDDLRENLRERIVKNTQVLAYVKDVYNVNPGDYPFLAYPGINFSTEGFLNIKLYFSFFKRLSEKDIRKALPVPAIDTFLHYYNQWNETNEYNTLHRGTTFAIKVDGKDEITFYFHLRLKGLPLGPPRHLSLTAAEEKGYNGLAVEYRNGKEFVKKYYYVYNRAVIADIAATSGLQIESGDWRDIDRMEYIESDNRNKMALVTQSAALTNQVLRKCRDTRFTEQIDELCREGNFMLIGPGVSMGQKDYSIYFIDAAKSKGYVPFDGVKSLYSKYLKHVL